MTVFCFSSAFAECRIELREKEWTWAETNLATFDGSITFDEVPTEKVILQLSLAASPEAADIGEVVFQSVNGKKLTLRKQSSEYVLSTGDGSAAEFVGSWKTPESVFFTKITVFLRVYSENGEDLLAEKQLTVTRSASEAAEKDDGRIRVKEDLDGWTKWIAAAAVLVWILAVIRIIGNHKNRKRESDVYL